MKFKEYRTVDKTAWPSGPWQHEPDKMQWLDEATGLPCLIVRGPSGALCGYVGVAEGHPLFNNQYESSGIEVHGGLTFSNFCAESDDECSHICHLPEPGEPDRVWWLGFDCAHAGDLCPRYLKEFDPWGYINWETYKSVVYVQTEVAALARQLMAMS